ncbi:MAG: histidinol-phosphate transaminase [Gammaproteobacteria bacterium]|nr:histidinol-phosphate transaminase [Gammaproteobacteria bacterium]
MSVADIARPEILRLQPYVAAEQVPGSVRLNANESPDSPWSRLDRTPLNRYPLVRPLELQQKLAAFYRVPSSQVLVTRGSTEGIDTLVRTFCRAYRDNIVITPPTFDMYKVYADVQGASLLEVPLAADKDYAFDADAVIAKADENTKLIFICTPNNPTGGLVSRDDVLKVVEARRDKSVVVVDEAYIEFSESPSLVGEVARYDNLAVLRTLSKAFALAGARCGVLIGCPELIALLGRVLSPYSFSTPVTERVLDVMSDAGFREAAALVQRGIDERKRVSAALAGTPAVTRVWPSRSNFILVRFREPEAVRAVLRERRILIREYAHRPELAGCARITVGTPTENDLLLDALRSI